MEEKGKILDKIKKLMRLSQSDNSHEAGLALERVKDLMDKYGVSMSDVVLSDVSEYQTCFLKASTLSEYQSNLVSSICMLFSCEATLGYGYDAAYKWRCRPNFIGISPNPEIAAYCFDILNKKLEKSRAEYIKTLKRVKTVNKTRRANDFAEGWVYGIYGTIKKMVPKKEVPEVVGKYLSHQKEKGKIKGEAKARANGKSLDIGDSLKGYSEGSKVELNKGVSGSSFDQLRLKNGEL